jgi:hypothetical protein
MQPIAVLVEQLAKLAQIVANSRRVDRRIFPTGIRFCARSGHAVARAGTDFAHRPDFLLFGTDV